MRPSPSRHLFRDRAAGLDGAGTGRRRVPAPAPPVDAPGRGERATGFALSRLADPAASAAAELRAAHRAAAAGRVSSAAPRPPPSHEDAFLYSGVPAAVRRARGPLRGAPRAGVRLGREGAGDNAHLSLGLPGTGCLCLQLYSVYLDGFLFCRVRYSQLHDWNEQVSSLEAGTSPSTETGGESCPQSALFL